MTMSARTAELLEARGLDVELVSRLGWGTEKHAGGEALVIPFRKDGEVVRRKFRTLEGEKKFWQDKGGEKVPWNVDVLKDASNLPLIITEGELDAVAAIQSGFHRVISVPDGAPPPGERDEADLKAGAKYNWLEPLKPYLTRELCPEIILAADGDDNGAALLHDLSILLGRFRCKYLTYPKGRDGARLKDLNEVLQQYGTKGVAETLSRAQYIKVAGVYRMSELPPLPPQRVYEIGFNLLSENYKLRLGDFVVVTGTPGYGKSSFVNDLCCRVAWQHDLKIAWASFEQAPQRDHRRALRSWFHERPEHQQDEREHHAADVWIDKQHVFIVPAEDDDVTLDWILDRMEAAVVQHGAAIIVLDPWNEMDHSRGRDETETDYIGRAIRALKRFAKAFQVHLIVVAHPTKSTKDHEGNYKRPTLYDISGSAHWYNKAELGVIVHRTDDLNTSIVVQKSRYHEIIGKPGEVNMHYSTESRRFVETERLR